MVIIHYLAELLLLVEGAEETEIQMKRVNRVDRVAEAEGLKHYLPLGLVEQEHLGKDFREVVVEVMELVVLEVVEVVQMELV